MPEFQLSQTTRLQPGLFPHPQHPRPMTIALLMPYQAPEFSVCEKCGLRTPPIVFSIADTTIA
jgi:hypothetical protein